MYIPRILTQTLIESVGIDIRGDETVSLESAEHSSGLSGTGSPFSNVRQRTLEGLIMSALGNGSVELRRDIKSVFLTN